MTENETEGTPETESLDEKKVDQEVKTEVVVAATEDTQKKPEPVPAERDEDDYEPLEVNLRNLLEAGAHYGHRIDKWNPKMLPYIYTQRSKIHIINLDVTLKMWEKAKKFILDVTSRGGSVLFVGTKHQARKVTGEAARRCDAFYVNHRWLGGTLSNFNTIKKSFSRMRKLEELLEKAADESSDVKIAKKEKLGITKQLEKLDVNLGGIRKMKKVPDLIFVIDIRKESIAVSEARKLHIPVVALVDTNVDPTAVNFPIASNDDAAKTVSLFLNAVSDAVNEGKEAYGLRLQRERTEEAKKVVSKKSSGKDRASGTARNGAGKNGKKKKATAEKAVKEKSKKTVEETKEAGGAAAG